VRLPDQSTGQVSQVLPTGNVVVTLDDDGHRVGAQPRQLELLPHAAEKAAEAAASSEPEPEPEPEPVPKPAEAAAAGEDSAEDDDDPFGA